jgi:hypothetical protein
MRTVIGETDATAISTGTPLTMIGLDCPRMMPPQARPAPAKPSCSSARRLVTRVIMAELYMT